MDYTNFKKRNPWVPIILFFVWLSFIAVFFPLLRILFSTEKDFTKFFSIFLFLGVSIFFLMYYLIYLYEIAKDLREITFTSPEEGNFLVYPVFIFFIVGIPLYIRLIYDFSKSMEEATGGRIPFKQNFYLLLFFPQLGTSILQNKINLLSEEEDKETETNLKNSLNN